MAALPGSSFHGIFQARVLDGGAIAFSGPIPYEVVTQQNCLRIFRSIPWAVISVNVQVSPQDGRRGLITGRGCMLSRFSRVLLFVTPWTVAHQFPLSVGFPRQEYRSGLPFSSPGDLPEPGVEPVSPALAGQFFTTESPGYKPLFSPRAAVHLIAASWGSVGHFKPSAAAV